MIKDIPRLVGCDLLNMKVNFIFYCCDEFLSISDDFNLCQIFMSCRTRRLLDTLCEFLTIHTRKRRGIECNVHKNIFECHISALSKQRVPTLSESCQKIVLPAAVC